MQYEEIDDISREQAEKELESGDPERIQGALLAAALSLDDWRWVQDQCLRFCGSKDVRTVSTALLCFAHLARLNGELDLDRVVPVLRRLRSVPELRGRIEDVSDDIEVYLGVELGLQDKELAPE